MYFARWFYDLTFFAFIGVILLNGVVFGIIIDTFGDLRGQAKEKQDKMASCCFICNLDNGVLDKEAGGFDLHVKQDHSVRTDELHLCECCCECVFANARAFELSPCDRVVECRCGSMCSLLFICAERHRLNSPAWRPMWQRSLQRRIPRGFPCTRSVHLYGYAQIQGASTI